jgi:SPP1 gp7 family putative phage head morphogenesis protein
MTYIEDLQSMATSIDILTPEEQNQYFQGIYEKKYGPDNIYIPLYVKTAESVFAAVRKGLAFTPDEFTGDLAALKQMHDNVYLFSGCKSVRQARDLQRLILDESGYLKPWRRFLQEAVQVHEVYNVNYLAAERQAAFTTAQAASQWKEIEQTKEMFPYLEYVTKEDGHVRQSHRLLNGIVRKVDDPFWDTHYPQVDWGCRCDVMRLTEEEGRSTPKKKIDTKKIANVPNPVFAFNPGKTNQVFGPKHPYFKELRKYPYLKELIPEMQINTL